MAEEKSNMMTMVLVGVGAYFLYEWWQGQQGTTVASTSTSATSGNPVAQTLIQGSSGAVTAGGLFTQQQTPPPTYKVPDYTPPTSQTTTLRTVIAASQNPGLINDQNFIIYMAGHGVGPDMQLTPGQIQTLLSGYTPPQTPPATGNIGGFTYTTKATYLQALINAVTAAAGGSTAQTGDEWNWFMSSQVGLPFEPDASIVTDQLNIGRSDSMPASTYYNTLGQLGLIPYPSGLSGLAATARGMHARTSHPLRGRINGRSF